VTHPIATVLNIMSEEGRPTRGTYHLTLGELIEKLKNANQYALVECSNGIIPGKPHSYRGYYSDLAFELEEPEVDFESATQDSLEVLKFLAICEEILDTTLEGYKGGDFVMDAKTPLWLSAWGDASDIAIIDAIRVSEGKFLLVVKALEE